MERQITLLRRIGESESAAAMICLMQTLFELEAMLCPFSAMSQDGQISVIATRGTKHGADTKKGGLGQMSKPAQHGGGGEKAQVC